MKVSFNANFVKLHQFIPVVISASFLYGWLKFIKMKNIKYANKNGR